MRARLITLLAFAVAGTALAADDSVGPAPQVANALLGWTVAGAVGAGIETIDGTDRHPVRTAELRADGSAIDRLRLTLYARYNHAADDNEFPDSSFLQAGVTLRYPF